ncbi:predicted protein [Histoplasma capsulatum H143]|uniref:Uncharacterized protein n=1 Tax=Ajellomyces capsulatus (strain H143) TaxID=544712 RepID=C6H580_AJECH|nr:predicted protein [Histoplasma capsulatum H143]
MVTVVGKKSWSLLETTWNKLKILAYGCGQSEKVSLGKYGAPEYPFQACGRRTKREIPTDRKGLIFKSAMWPLSLSGRVDPFWPYPSWRIRLQISEQWEAAAYAV